MSLSAIIQREIEVAFSKSAQPVWLRMLKYILLAAFLYFFRGSKWFWIILSVMIFIALCVHCWYRYKTNGWTKSYGSWDYEKNKPGQRAR